MPALEVDSGLAPGTEPEPENNVPSSQPVVGIIYPPPEVRSILSKKIQDKSSRVLIDNSQQNA